MDRVEKAARAIPDEAVEAAWTAYLDKVGDGPDGGLDGIRAAIQAALAVMEREGEALSGYGDYTPVTIRSGTVASPRPEAVGEAVKAERERCAKIAEATIDVERDDPRSMSREVKWRDGPAIAAAIRQGPLDISRVP